jgi:IS5 family transposase
LAIPGLEEITGTQMYVFQHTGQLSIEAFHSPFGGKLDPNNRWVLLHKLIP